MKRNIINIANVPTNVITGFLGVGKTTAILHLLKSKPVHERWAVLVNEFGEIGIDGHLFSSQVTEKEGIFIREVPGGCMCCAAGLPMQIALNQLLAHAVPDRLLIEPTGLGHPEEVLQSLCEDAYKDALSIQKTVALLDARNLADARYTQHIIFNQQLEIADIIIANKSDLYKPADKENLQSYMRNQNLNAEVVLTEYGVFDIDLLSGPSSAMSNIAQPEHQHQHKNLQALNEELIPACGYLRASNKGEGYCSTGWRFSASTLFDYQKLWVFLNSLQVERMKAVFNTEKGSLAFNMSELVLTEAVVGSVVESRIEIIAKEISADWEQTLFACIARDK